MMAVMSGLAAPDRSQEGFGGLVLLVDPADAQADDGEPVGVVVGAADALPPDLAGPE